MEWEYQITKTKTGGARLANIDHITADYLNGFGQQGWEFVQALTMWEDGSNHIGQVYFFFKRQKT